MTTKYDSYQLHDRVMARQELICSLVALQAHDLKRIAEREKCADTAARASAALEVARLAHMIQALLYHSATTWERWHADRQRWERRAVA
jgi:hypothetical protein